MRERRKEQRKILKGDAKTGKILNNEFWDKLNAQDLNLKDKNSRKKFQEFLYRELLLPKVNEFFGEDENFEQRVSQ
jgi:hypothetical protein